MAFFSNYTIAHSTFRQKIHICVHHYQVDACVATPECSAKGREGLAKPSPNGPRQIFRHTWAPIKSSHSKGLTLSVQTPTKWTGYQKDYDDNIFREKKTKEIFQAYLQYPPFSIKNLHLAAIEFVPRFTKLEAHIAVNLILFTRIF